MGASWFRLLCLMLFLFTLFSLVISRFYHIQIVEGEKWKTEARRQHYFVIKEPFLRGSFISNASIKKGHPETPQKLVTDIQKFHLHIDPNSIPDPLKNLMAEQLIARLELSPEEKIRFHQEFGKKSRNRKLASWLDKNKQETILQWWIPFSREHKIARNSLFFVTDYQRSYPFGKLLGQVLQTVRNQKDELTQQSTPTGGLELYFDSYLQGIQGKRRLMRSPRNSFEMGEVIESPVNGADIYLTINHYLQAIAEEELEKKVKKCKAKSGWVVMMDPKTGEILALAQYPFFFPSDYQSYFNDKNLIEHTALKALTDAIEPGSVFKPFTLCTALLANQELAAKNKPSLFDPEEKIPCSDGRFAGRSRLLKDIGFHHYLNMDMAVQKSSNIYMARLAERVVSQLGCQWYRDVLHERFGFGKKTNIELPSETAGMLPRIGKKYPNGALEWSVSTPPSLAMGYNLQVNSLQLVRAYAILANGGYFVQPTLVRQIIKNGENGEKIVLLDNTSEERKKAFPCVLPKKIVEKVVLAMKYTTKPGGTASKADVFGFTEVGKTSTVEKLVNGAYCKTLHRCAFIGFTPVTDPAFVLLAVIDEPEYGFTNGVANHRGGAHSALLFREISKRSLEYLGITPDDPYGYPVGDPRRDAAKADWMPETQKLKEKYQEWNAPQKRTNENKKTD